MNPTWAVSETSWLHADAEGEVLDSARCELLCVCCFSGRLVLLLKAEASSFCFLFFTLRIVFHHGYASGSVCRLLQICCTSFQPFVTTAGDNIGTERCTSFA